MIIIFALRGLNEKCRYIIYLVLQTLQEGEKESEQEEGERESGRKREIFFG